MSKVPSEENEDHFVHLSCWIEMQTRQVGIKSSFKSLNESLTPLWYKEDDSRRCLFLFSRTFLLLFRILKKFDVHKNYSHFQSLGWLSHLLGGVPGTCTATPADGSSSSFSRIDDGLWNWWMMVIVDWWLVIDGLNSNKFEFGKKRSTPVPVRDWFVHDWDDWSVWILQGRSNGKRTNDQRQTTTRIHDLGRSINFNLATSKDGP